MDSFGGGAAFEREAGVGEKPEPLVLVTGAGGSLGRAVVDALTALKARVRGLGRRAAPEPFRADWRRADLLTGDGLAAAVDGVGAVVHCASDPRRPSDDLAALDRLIAALAPNRAHLVFVGIAGIEAAAEKFEYYRVKLECERKVAQSGVPYTIVRATQFHPFVDLILRKLSVGPLLFAPRMTLQPVDIGFVAKRLAGYALGPPRGRVPDVHGPEALDTGTLTAEWLKARHQSKIGIRLPSIGPLAALARIQRVDGDAGGRTWSEWLAAEASGESVYSS
jgi:uncharacterized protein YbjT (DUF2867 family)